MLALEQSVRLARIEHEVSRDALYPEPSVQLDRLGGMNARVREPVTHQRRYIDGRSRAGQRRPIARDVIPAPLVTLK